MKSAAEADICAWNHEMQEQQETVCISLFVLPALSGCVKPLQGGGGTHPTTPILKRLGYSEGKDMQTS